MIALVDFSFEFAGRYLFKDSNWHIKRGEKIGLVGLNGTGKSTLLKVISGEYELREGRIEFEKGVSIGFFNQDLLSMDLKGDLLNVVLQGKPILYNAEKEMGEIYEKLAENSEDSSLLDRLGELQDDFNRLGGYTWRSEAETILEGLGFSTADMAKPFGKFSGGWRMRALLAKLLLSEPDLLMLDEPTNHLDLPTIEWLETYLQSYNGTFIVVSHDRHFLDNTVTRTVEVSYSQLNHFKGNFTKYLDLKAENDALMARKFQNQQSFINQQMQFISRFRYKASKAKAVQSRVRQLDKMDKIEIPEEEKRKFEIRFNIKITPGKQILKIDKISKAYPGIALFKQASAQIYRGDKIAFVGANGKGKTTLLKLIAEHEPYEGVIEPGWNVETAFFAQHQMESLNLKNNLLEEIARAGGQYTDAELRSTLGCFLFSGEEVFKKVKVLSGGERSRLALAKTLLMQANFLLLDEPTNHLDMFSASVLAQALEDYKGTFVVVSHDRTFLSRVANKIWWIEDGQLREFIGSYDEYAEYLRKKEEQSLTEQDKMSVREPKKELGKSKKTEAKKPKISKFSYAQIEKKMAELDAKLADFTNDLAEIDIRAAKPEVAADFEQLQSIIEERNLILSKSEKTQKEYDALFDQWMEQQS
ncbi:MAG: ABC-F family ATP-binding cassette domain-containing protein [Bacteroidia bacterium]|nr:ABC-F family ATP-binding cassette domain-containing protein [Bacteroidia bacterium]